MHANNKPFGEVIYSYSRKQAIKDGVLIDLSQWKVTRDHWKLNLCCTDTVFNLIESAVLNEGKDYEGIIHDLSILAKSKIGKDNTGDTLYFPCIVGERTVNFKLHCGPGDTPYPVLTLLLASES